MSSLKILTGAVILALGMIGSAQASLINGQLDFVGFAAIDRENGQYVSIDYLFGPFVVSATDDYAATIDVGDAVNVIDPINFTTISLPETIWSIDIFSFSLESVTLNNGTTVGGNGMISAAGFDDTDGFWSFTSQGADDGFFSFSATTVPEPSTIALMVIGLFGLGFARLKVRN